MPYLMYCIPVANRNQQPTVSTLPNMAGKRLKTDVPDPPEEVLAVATTDHVTSPTPHKVQIFQGLGKFRLIWLQYVGDGKYFA